VRTTWPITGDVVAALTLHVDHPVVGGDEVPRFRFGGADQVGHGVRGALEELEGEHAERSQRCEHEEAEEDLPREAASPARWRLGGDHGHRRGGWGVADHEIALRLSLGCDDAHVIGVERCDHEIVGRLVDRLVDALVECLRRRRGVRRLGRDEHRGRRRRVVMHGVGLALVVVRDELVVSGVGLVDPVELVGHVGGAGGVGLVEGHHHHRRAARAIHATGGVIGAAELIGGGLEQAGGEQRQRLGAGQLRRGLQQALAQLGGRGTLVALGSAGAFEHGGERAEVGRHRHQLAHPRRERRDGGVRAEREVAGDRLVQGEAQRVHVGAPVERASEALLGSGVPGHVGGHGVGSLPGGGAQQPAPTRSR
jgi:hypothetical protein